ncbi:MAG: hypothetical protein IKU29_06250 [Parabacteroides sp.]|nr:hypothetical protein [Parabacteroides sp.]
MEDFVTFEIAKKLEEKGFNWPCYHYYRKNKKDLFMIFPSENWDYDEERINAPSISQARKWLIKEKKLFIEISMSFNKYYFEIYCTDSYDETYGNQINRKFNEIDYNTDEQATLAGIEYALDNLI